MSTTELQVELPASVSEDEARLMLALKLYESGKASLGQSARLANFSKRAFMEVLGRNQIPIFDYSPDELREEVDS